MKNNLIDIRDIYKPK